MFNSPAGEPGVVTVGAVFRKKELAPYSNFGSVIDVGGRAVVAFAFLAVGNFEVVEVLVQHLRHFRAAGGVYNLVDFGAEFVFLDQHRLCGQAGVKLELVQSREVGWIGNAHEQTVTALDQRQRVVLFD